MQHQMNTCIFSAHSPYRNKAYGIFVVVAATLLVALGNESNVVFRQPSFDFYSTIKVLYGQVNSICCG